MNTGRILCARRSQRSADGPDTPASVLLVREIKRHTAYFRGLSQAFGEHESLYEENRPVNWLLGERQVGLILGEHLKRPAFRSILSQPQERAAVTLTSSCLRIGNMRYAISERQDRRGREALIELLRGSATVHLYLTYHFMYPKGTRIITLSQKPPLRLIYKEMAPMRIRVL